MKDGYQGPRNARGTPRRMTEPEDLAGILARKKGGFRRLPDDQEACQHPEHNPPHHIYLEPGNWEWTCPGCGTTKTIRVPRVLCSKRWANEERHAFR